MAKSAGKAASGGPVKSRLVFNFPGFEPTPPLAQLDRLRAGAEKTGENWGFTFERQSADVVTGANHAVSESIAKGPNWQTRTRIIQFIWSDVIEAYEREPFPLGMFRNFPKFIAFFTDGTVGRYYRASKRYWGFTIFPLLLIAIFLIVSALVFHFLIAAVAPQFSHPLLTIALTLVATLLACRWPGQRLYLLLTINDWGFARDMVYRINPDIELRYRTFAETLTEEIKRSRHDEIVIVGHSFGTVWAAAALAIALEANPKLLENRNVTFLALGSSLLKIALAPDAGFMRDWMARIVAEPNLLWHEIQTKDDLIAFYKADPFEQLGITDLKATLRIDRVKYKDAMEKSRYYRMLKSPYRTHRQYILYQDRRTTFDFIFRLFGPLSCREQAADPAAIERFDATGRLAPPAVVIAAASKTAKKTAGKPAPAKPAKAKTVKTKSGART